MNVAYKHVLQKYSWMDGWRGLNYINKIKITYYHLVSCCFAIEILFIFFYFI